MSDNLWEYHFRYHTCNLSSRTKKIFNPFTKEEYDLPADDGLNAEEAAAVQQIFAEHDIQRIHEFDGCPGYVIYANDWISFRCYELGGANAVDDLDTFITVTDLSRSYLETILRIAREGNLAFMAQLGADVRIVDRDPSARELARWPDAMKLSSAEELRRWFIDRIQGERVDERIN